MTRLFLEDYAVFERPVIILDGKCYQLKKEDGTPRARLHSQDLRLVELGDAVRLEKESLSRSIDSRLRIEAARKERRLPSGIPLTEIVSRLPQEFPRFVGEHDIPLELRTDHILPTAESIASKTPLAQYMYSRRMQGMIVVNGDMYELIPRGSNIVLELPQGTRAFGVKRMFSLERYVEKYQRKVMQAFSEEREAAQKDIEMLGRRLPRDYALSVDDEGGGNLSIFLRCAPFALRWNGDNYLCKGFKARYQVSIGRDWGMIISEPRIIEPQNYQHPFVFMNNQFCFGHPPPWKMLEVNFKVPRQYTGDAEAFARWMSRPARELLIRAHLGHREGYDVGAKSFSSLRELKTKTVPREVRIYAFKNR